jgi:TonB family protein
MKFPLDAPDSISSSKVKLRLLIDTSGNVLKAMIDISGGAAFDAAAKNAALQAKFSPAAQNGQPVKVWYEASVVFKRPN